MPILNTIAGAFMAWLVVALLLVAILPTRLGLAKTLVYASLIALIPAVFAVLASL